jgi:hypothetical protein
MKIILRLISVYRINPPSDDLCCVGPNKHKEKKVHGAFVINFFFHNSICETKTKTTIV